MHATQEAPVPSLLRPGALEAARDELKSLEGKLHNPLIQDKGEVYRQIRALDKTLETQTPKPFVGGEKDAAVRREAELRKDWLEGMPSMEEMRKAPPGAVEKHMAWEQRTSRAVLEWKNLRLRLHATEGDYSDGSVANIERYRPRDSSLNMDSAQIPGKQYFMPETTAPAVPLSDAEIAKLRKLAPDIADKLGLLGNDDRAEVKAILKAAPDDGRL